MTHQEKLEIVLRYLPYTNIEIAKKFGINTSNLNHWKNTEKLKQYQYYALQGAFNIPIEIFENDNIDSKEKIKQVLENNQNMNNNSRQLNNKKFDTRVLNLLQGKWYLYNYYSLSDKVFEDILTIKGTQVTHINENGEIDYLGEILDINSFYTIIVLKKSNSSISIIINNRDLEKEMYYLTMIAKSSYYQDDFTQYALFSKTRIDIDNAKIVLGERNNLQLYINRSFLNRIVKFSENRLNESMKYSDEHFLNYLKSKEKLFLHFNLNNFEHTLSVESENSVKWYSNGMLHSIGKINFYSNELLIIFENTTRKKSYILMEKSYKNVMPFVFKADTYETNENIIGIGIISDKKLILEEIEYILGKKWENILSITNIWKKINEIFYTS